MSYFSWKEDEAYREGRRDAEYGRRNYEHDEHAFDGVDKAYYDGKHDAEREERNRRELYEEEQRQEEREQRQQEEHRQYIRDVDEQEYQRDYEDEQQRQYNKAMYDAEQPPQLEIEDWADRNCDCNGTTISDADPRL